MTTAAKDLGFELNELADAFSRLASASISAREAFQNSQALTIDNDTLPTYHNSQCQSCAYFYGGIDGGNHMVCAVHPSGPEGDNCRDWEDGDLVS